MICNLWSTSFISQYITKFHHLLPLPSRSRNCLNNTTINPALCYSSNSNNLHKRQPCVVDPNSFKHYNWDFYKVTIYCHICMFVLVINEDQFSLSDFTLVIKYRYFALFAFFQILHFLTPKDTPKQIRRLLRNYEDRSSYESLFSR